VLPGTVTRPTVRACYLAVSGPVAASVFVIGTVVASLTWPGYDHRVQPLSDLGGTAAPAPVIQNLTFVVFGAAVVALGVGLSVARLGRGVAGLVVVFGAAMAVLSVLPSSPGCAAGTATDVAHGAVAVVGFLAVTAAMLVLSRGNGSVSARWRRRSGVTGVVTLALLVSWLVASGVDPASWRAGLIQRAMMISVLLWLGVAGWLLDRAANLPLPRGQAGVSG
jgi:hypothetical membrane protein